VEHSGVSAFKVHTKSQSVAFCSKKAALDSVLELAPY